MAIHDIPAGTPFLDALARGLRERTGGDPLALARATILLPTRRAARALAAAVLRVAAGGAALAPRTLALGDLDNDEAWTEADLAERDGVRPALAPVERLVRLADLVRARPEIAGDAAAATRLASSLAALLDSAALEDATLARLDTLVEGDLARHWQRSLAALDAARRAWPAQLAALGAIDPADRRVRLLRALAARWRRERPAGLIVAAGSTGSIPATAELLAVIAALPDGHVVLPGLDRDLDEPGWAAVREDPCHPQHGLARLLAALDVERGAVGRWIDAPPSPRARMLGQALLPAERSDAWRAMPKAPDAALAGVEFLEADGPDREAGAIALALRGALEVPGRTAALVTPDRRLARRVSAELGRWGIAIDDSAGVPLASTAPVALLRHVAALAAGGGAVSLLATLKHPAARLGRDRGELLREARRLERKLLRRSNPPGELDAILAAWGRDRDHGALAGDVARILGELRGALGAPSVAPRALLAAQIAAAEAFASGPDSPEAEALWEGEAGEAASRFVRELGEALGAMGEIRGAGWPVLFDALLAGIVFRPRAARHPRLAIWGPLEARLQAADFVVLGALNEGTWPPASPEDPWLSRDMRRKLGLPPAERRVGLSAHDFVMAASAPAVLLTRSRKVDGVPTRPSRWLARLDALLAGDERWADAKRTSWAQWHGELDRPGSQQPIAKPRPTPPVAERPRRLAVTQIETLIRDPYAIWAREILGLRPLDPLDPLPSAGERGSVIHDALRRFHDAVAADPDADRLATLLACGEQAFAALLARPAVRAIWWPRFARAAAWLVEWERGRRAAGVTPVAAEIRGALTLARPGGEFRLDARADRIDRLADGSLSILDWKTGQVPSARQMAAGLAPQLALEAVIAGERGFAGGVGGVVGELVHVRLTGGTPAGEDLPYAPTGTQPTVSGLIEAARGGLARLVDEFDRPDKPYLSRPRPRFQRHAGRYDHLARVREWSDAVESEAP